MVGKSQVIDSEELIKKFYQHNLGAVDAKFVDVSTRFVYDETNFY